MYSSVTLDEFLAPITSSIKPINGESSHDVPHFVMPDYKRLIDDLPHQEIVTQFIREAENVKVTVHTTNKATLLQTLLQLLSNDEPGVVMSAQDGRIDSLGLPQILSAMDVGYNEKMFFSWDKDLSKAENITRAADARYGLVYATAAIAETGTVLHLIQPDSGRSLSLLPPVSIFLIDASSIFPKMGDVLSHLKTVIQGDQETTSSQACFITGPSVTSDIELVRVEGVHGPMYVHYVILTDA